MYIHDQFDNDVVLKRSKRQFVLKGSQAHSFSGRREKKVANETTTTTVVKGSLTNPTRCRCFYFHVVFDNVIVVVF